MIQGQGSDRSERPRDPARQRSG